MKKANPKAMLLFGCKSGIGFEILKLSESYGFNVVGISKNRLNQEFSNPKAFLQCDLGVIENLSKIKEFLKKNKLKFDVCIYNTGYAVAGDILQLQEKDILKMVNVNYTMPLLIIKSLMNENVLKKNSKIIYVSTTAIEKQIPEISMYAKNKKMFEEVIKTHINVFERNRGVRLIIVRLGAVNTNFGVNFSLNVRENMKNGLSPQKVAKYVLNIAKGRLGNELTEICIKK
ncbi:hypothetical protein ES705_09745 [subsurface metagenome]